jgi:hypothetical protein
MAQEIKFTLRVPIELYEILKAWAQKEHRSLHSQIIHILVLAVERWEKNNQVN